MILYIEESKKLIIPANVEIEQKNPSKAKNASPVDRNIEN
jgi:hypothetical protein